MDELATTSAGSLYDEDFYAWTQEQASLLRRGRLASADLPNILEEIETSGRKEIAELRSRYKVLAQHLLKQIYKSETSSRSWQTTIPQSLDIFPVVPPFTREQAVDESWLP